MVYNRGHWFIIISILNLARLWISAILGQQKQKQIQASLSAGALPTVTMQANTGVTVPATDCTLVRGVHGGCFLFLFPLAPFFLRVLA